MHVVTQTFFGRLENILSFELPASAVLGLDQPQYVVFAVVKTCRLAQFEDENRESGELPIDIHYYSTWGSLDVVDLTTLQCVIGRIQIGKLTAIIDRTGLLERAWYNEDENV
jgi:hypothetical protein